MCFPNFWSCLTRRRSRRASRSSLSSVSSISVSSGGFRVHKTKLCREYIVAGEARSLCEEQIPEQECAHISVEPEHEVYYPEDKPTQTVATEESFSSFLLPKHRRHIISVHESFRVASAWNPVEDLLAIGYDDSTCYIYDLRDLNADKKRILCRQHDKEEISQLLGFTVYTVVWSNDGKTLAVGNLDGFLHLFTHDGRCYLKLGQHSNGCRVAKWNSTDSHIITGGWDGVCLVFAVKEELPEIPVQRFDLYELRVNHLEWHTDEIFAASGGLVVNILSVHSDQPVATINTQREIHRDEIMVSALDPQGIYVATSGRERIINIWKTTGEWVEKYTDHCNSVWSLQWSPTGPGTQYPDQTKLLASGSYDFTVRLWDMNRNFGRKCVYVIRNPCEEVSQVLFSNDGARLACSSYDGYVRIFSMHCGMLLFFFRTYGIAYGMRWNRSYDRMAVEHVEGLLAKVTVLDFTNYHTSSGLPMEEEKTCFMPERDHRCLKTEYPEYLVVS